MSILSSPTVKNMEKELEKEKKAEEAHVKHIRDDLASTEKAHEKAEKAAHKAEKKELAATKAEHKATHNHDIAVANKHSAEQEAQLKKQQDLKLEKDIEAKKAAADAAIQDQHTHNQAREARLAELVITSAHGVARETDIIPGDRGNA